MFDDVFHTIDPKGDVLLILRSPNAPFAVWDVDEEIESLAVKRTLEQGFPSPGLPPSEYGEKLAEVEPLAEPEEQPEEDSKEDPEEEPKIKYLVSSRHLTLASSKFEAELKGPWMEGSVNDIDGYYHINASEWDPDALLILMRIFHGQTRSVPRDISLEMLAKIAVLVDYYDAPEVVEVYASIWIVKLEDELPTQNGRDMVLWLLVSHVFQLENVFSRMTQIAVTQSLKPVPTLGLPIPSIVVDLVDWQRQKAVDYIMNTLQGLLDAFRTESSGRQFECSSMLLGALTKEMNKHELLDPAPRKPYTGYSIVDTEKMVKRFRCPSWNHPRDPYSARTYCNPHSSELCHLTTILSTGMKNRPTAGKEGLKLSEIHTLTQKRSSETADENEDCEVGRKWTAAIPT